MSKLYSEKFFLEHGEIVLVESHRCITGYDGDVSAVSWLKDLESWTGVTKLRSFTKSASKGGRTQGTEGLWYVSALGAVSVSAAAVLGVWQTGTQNHQLRLSYQNVDWELQLRE
jgi:hypothetical protein